MNKKYKVLMIAAASVALVAGSLFAVGNNGGFLQLEASRAKKTHEISFTADDVTAGTYDEYYCVTPLLFSKSDCIEDKDGIKYSITSRDFDPDYGDGTGLYYNDSVTFGGDYIAEFTGNGYNTFSVNFLILRRASFVFEQSFVSYYLDVADEDHYHNDIQFSVYTDDNVSEYVEYRAYYNFAPKAGHKIMINEVKLVFSCER